jgi:hypothetical protein
MATNKGVIVALASLDARDEVEPVERSLRSEPSQDRLTAAEDRRFGHRFVVCSLTFVSIRTCEVTVNLVRMRRAWASGYSTAAPSDMEEPWTVTDS